MGGVRRVIHADGPVLVFGGPYGNLQATAAVLDEARARGIDADRVICTGDLAAYCANPSETIDIVRASGIHVVAGNCDQQLAAGAADCNCGFAPGSACDRLAQSWFQFSGARITPAQRSWLATLPEQLELRIAGMRLAIIHGGAESTNSFLFASTPAKTKLHQLDLLGVDGIVAGHCGLPFTERLGTRLWHNAGVVGLPANDGTPRVWFSVLTPVAGGLEIEHRALDYDHEAAAAAMLAAGLPPDYRQSLSTGLWPSCDVLPFTEIRAAGLPLDPGAVIWARKAEASSGALDDQKRKNSRGAALLWPVTARDNRPKLAPEKFKDPAWTLDGQTRAHVPLVALDTLWLNTGTLCNITCRNCYIESSPRNDQLVYLSPDDVRPLLDEISRDGLPTREIGITGGEPFMNPHIFELMEMCLERGFRLLVLTNAMRPMQRHKARLAQLGARYGELLSIRVSMDHYTAERHEDERGAGTFKPTLEGLCWLARNGFAVSIAARTMWGESENLTRAGFAQLFAAHGIDIDHNDPAVLVLFPEMDEAVDVPEVTTACWDILGKRPTDMMCARSRMIVKRKGAERAAVVSCTLLPYDPAFELGHTLAEADRPVPLNHPHCARFCVLGGASCSPS